MQEICIVKIEPLPMEICKLYQAAVFIWTIVLIMWYNN